MANKKHSELTAAPDLHVPKGFTEAANFSAGIRNEQGDLEWRLVKDLHTKVNLTATTDPTVNDDSANGYQPYSRWLNTVTDRLFFCVDAAPGSANWAVLLPPAIATINPTINHDELNGYKVGNIWVNKTSGAAFICVKNTTGAALWAAATAPIVVGIDHSTLSNLDQDTHLQYLNRSGVRPMTGALNMGANKVTNMAAPVNPADGARKAEVDSEATARQNADTAESLARTNADNAEALARTNAIAAEATLRADADSAEASTRASADTAEATTRANADTALQANINSEASARAAEDATFLKLNGSRAMTGALNMGGQNVTSVGTVNGVTVENHKARHAPGGADAIATAAPTTPLSASTSNAEGSGTAVARNDHSHAINTATPVSTGSANAPGTAAELARADHIHNTVLASQLLQSQTDFFTTSTSYVSLTSLSATPAAGTYLAIYSVECLNSGNGSERNFVAIAVAGGVVPDSERSVGISGGAQVVVSNSTILTLNGSQLVTVQGRVVGGLGTFSRRTLALVRIG